MDDLYFFFDKTLRDLKVNITNLQLSPGVVIQFEGSSLDMFIKRCAFSFSTLMFEDLQKLFDCFQLYKEGKEYHFNVSTMVMDYWAEEKASNMENESISKDYESTKKELSQIDGPKFNKKHLLRSINDCLGRKDLESISSLHQYFDYNINFIDRTSTKPIHSVKVHQPELNLSGL